MKDEGERANIDRVLIRKILDSRGNPTVEVDVLSGSHVGRCAAPSGASTGKHEVLAFPKSGIEKAMADFRYDATPRLVGRDASDQKGLDALLRELDGTGNFGKMGGNLAIATSIAAAKVSASRRGIPLYRYVSLHERFEMPYPFGNVIGGGRHAIGGTDIQEFMVVSFGPSAKDSVFANALVHRKVRERLVKARPRDALGKGDEGAWVARIGNHTAMDILSDACKEASDELGFKCLMALDMAASEFYEKGRYRYKEGYADPAKQIEFVADIVDEYGLYSVEDPLEQEDYEGYAQLTKAVGKKCLIVGDDLFVTNVNRLAKGIDMGAANAILVKPNQIGTLTDMVETVKLAQARGFKTIMSHRSGETTDDTIAHLAVGLGSHGIKTGAVGGERIAKLNELVRIEEGLKRS